MHVEVPVDRPPLILEWTDRVGGYQEGPHRIECDDAQPDPLAAVCIYCGVGPRVPKSHIVPEYGYERIRHDGPILVLDQNLQHAAAPRQKGHYEPLLCAKCESLFNERWEWPCLDFFRGLPDTARQGTTVALRLPDELRGLVLSVFWRAAHSRYSAWNSFLAGCDIARLRRVLDGTPDPNVVTYLHLVAMDDGTIVKGIVAPPWRLSVPVPPPDGRGETRELTALCLLCAGMQFLLVFRKLGAYEPAVGCFECGGPMSVEIRAFPKAWSLVPLEPRGHAQAET